MFEDLISLNLPALPLVENDKIVGILESRSILNLKPEYLQKPVKDFLKVSKTKAILIKPSMTARKVIELMLADAESRVWCEQGGKITGCVSKSDIIGAVVGVVPQLPSK